MSLYHNITKVSNNSDLLIFGPSTIGVYSCKSKRITKNKDSLMMITNTATKKQNNNEPYITVALIKNLCSCESERANITNVDKKQNETL